MLRFALLSSLFISINLFAEAFVSDANSTQDATCTQFYADHNINAYNLKDPNILKTVGENLFALSNGNVAAMTNSNLHQCAKKRPEGEPCDDYTEGFQCWSDWKWVCWPFKWKTFVCTCTKKKDGSKKFECGWVS